MSFQEAYYVLGAGTITISAGTPAWGIQPGCCAAAITDNGAGDFQVTMADGCAIDSTESIIIVSGLGATATIGGVVHTSDTSKRILAADAAGALADLPVSVTFLKKAVG